MKEIFLKQTDGEKVIIVIADFQTEVFLNQFLRVLCTLLTIDNQHDRMLC